MKSHPFFAKSFLPRILAATALVASLGVGQSVMAQSGTWNVNANGLWSGSSNWLGGVIADGSGNTADFNTLNITGDRMVSLDSSRTIGNLIFGDVTTLSNGWIINNNGSSANVLTLAGGTPAITVNALGSLKNANLNLEVAGTSGMTKEGTGTLVLSGSNSFSGTVTINNGLLQIGNAGTTGSINSGVAVVTNAAGTGGLGFNRTDTVAFDNVISGAGRIQQNGSGTTVITNAGNSYSGNTQINAGTLRGSDSTTFSGATGTTTVLGNNSQINLANNTTLQLRANGLNDASAQTIRFKNSVLVSAAAANLTIDVDRQSGTGGTGKTLGLTGGFTLSSNSTLNVTGGNGFGLDLSNGNFTVGTGGTSGIVTINPTTANVTIGNMTSSGNTNPHTLDLNGTSTGNLITGVMADGGAVGVLTLTKSNTSTWTLSGSSSFTGGTTINNGTLQIGNAGTTGSINGNVSTGSSSAILAFNRSNAYTFSGTVSGSGQVRQVGSGTTTLTAANTYTGSTSITAGSLLLSAAGSLGTGNVTIGANGTLDISAITAGSYTLSSTQTLNGDGIVNATGKILVVNGTFNPGSSPGDFDVVGGFTLGGTSTSNFEINGLTTGLFDSVQVTGAITFGGTLNLTTGYAAQLGDSVDLFDWGSTTGTFTAITGTALGGGLSWDTTNLYTTGVITVVPEPAAWAMISMGGTLLLTLRRRRS